MNGAALNEWKIKTFICLSFYCTECLRKSKLDFATHSLTTTRTNFQLKVHQHGPHAWLCSDSGCTKILSTFFAARLE